jgi:hypothetical protein
MQLAGSVFHDDLVLEESTAPEGLFRGCEAGFEAWLPGRRAERSSIRLSACMP